MSLVASIVITGPPMWQNLTMSVMAWTGRTYTFYFVLHKCTSNK